jgi:hypothetical protein
MIRLNKNREDRMATDKDQNHRNRNLEQDNQAAKEKLLPGIPSDVAEFVGGRPIVKGEDPEQYDKLLRKLAAFINPADPIEWIWLKGMADAHWEALRARRIRDQSLDLGRYKAMKRVTENLLQDKRSGPPFHELIAKKVASFTALGGDAKLAEFLAQHGLDPSVIAAEAFLNRSQLYEQADRIAAAADKRRDRLFNDIARHRVGRVDGFKRATDVVDAEEVTDSISPLRVTKAEGSPDDER